MEFLQHYVVTAVIFIVIDAVWLSVIANKFYKKQLGSLLAKKPNFVAAAAFYVLYLIAILVFALNPALDQGSLGYATSHAALLGLTMYATYDLTNHSTLKNWPAIVTFVDMAWGTFVTTLVTACAYGILNY